MNTDMQNIESDEISKRINRERKRVVCLSTSQWKIILIVGLFWFDLFFIKTRLYGNFILL
jgi:hypothetical protein